MVEMNFSSGVIRKYLNHKPEYTLEEIVTKEDFNMNMFAEINNNFQLINYLSREDNFDKLVRYFLTPNNDKNSEMDCLYELAEKVMISSEKKYLEKISERKDFLAHIFSPLTKQVGASDSAESVQRLLKVALNYSKVMVISSISILTSISEEDVKSCASEPCDENSADDSNDDCCSGKESVSSKDNDDNKEVVETEKTIILNTNKSVKMDKEKCSKFVDIFVHNFCVYPNIYSEFFSDLINAFIDNRIMYMNVINNFFNFLLCDNEFFVVFVDRFLGLSEDGYDNENLMEQMANFITDSVTNLKRLEYLNESLTIEYGGHNNILINKLLSYALDSSHGASQKSLLSLRIVNCFLQNTSIKEQQNPPDLFGATFSFFESFANIIGGSTVVRVNSSDASAPKKENESDGDEKKMDVENSGGGEIKKVFLNLSQGPVEPFGEFRLEALGIVEKILVSDSNGVWNVVNDFDVILDALSNVFYKYKWNTFLHASVYNIFKMIITSEKPAADDVRKKLFLKYGFVERLAVSEETDNGDSITKFDYSAFNTKLFTLISESKNKIVKDPYDETFTKDEKHKAVLTGLQKRSKEESSSLDKSRHKIIRKTFDEFINFFTRSGIPCPIDSDDDSVDVIDDDDDDDDDYVPHKSKTAAAAATTAAYAEIDIFSDFNEEDFYSSKGNSENNKNVGDNTLTENDHTDGDNNVVNSNEDNNNNTNNNNNVDDDDENTLNKNDNLDNDKDVNMDVNNKTSISIDNYITINNDDDINIEYNNNNKDGNDDDGDALSLPPEKKAKS